MSEKNTTISVTKRKPSTFGQFWFVLLLLAGSSQLLAFLYWWVLGEPITALGWQIYVYATSVYPSLIAYGLLILIWALANKRAVFPGKWVALSTLFFIPVFWFSVTGGLMITLLPAIITIILWVLYNQSRKKEPVAAPTATPTATCAPTTYIPAAAPAVQSNTEQVVLERTMFFNLLKITVTNKRVMYKGIFWRRVNLPLNRISAVDTAIFCSLHIGSSAGSIRMSLFRHYREVYETISALLNEVK